MDSNEKAFGILSYFGPLFVIPLIVGGTSFTRFHANQGLLLFILEAVIGAASAILCNIPVIRFIGYIISGVGGLVCFIGFIYGIISAAQGEEKALPVLRDIHIIG